MYRVTKTLVSVATALALLAPVASLARSENAPPKRGDMATTTTASTTPARGQGWALGSLIKPGQLGKEACIALTRDLGPGVQGDDVRRLQDLLKLDPEVGFTASSTGFFGPLTAQAIMRFQAKHSVASSTAGRVGPLTRAFLHRKCGLGLGGGAGGTSTEHKAAIVIGVIEAASSTSITVKGSRTDALYVVHFNASTTIRVSATTTPGTRKGTATDFVSGSSVIVEGLLQDDESVLAKRITIQRPKKR